MLTEPAVVTNSIFAVEAADAPDNVDDAESGAQTYGSMIAWNGADQLALLDQLAEYAGHWRRRPGRCTRFWGRPFVSEQRALWYGSQKKLTSGIADDQSRRARHWTRHTLRSLILNDYERELRRPAKFIDSE